MVLSSFFSVLVSGRTGFLCALGLCHRLGFCFAALFAHTHLSFHLPESTLVMLVSALAGREHVLHAYEEAIKERYRFFSFGDAMFIHD